MFDQVVSVRRCSLALIVVLSFIAQGCEDSPEDGEPRRASDQEGVSTPESPDPDQSPAQESFGEQIESMLADFEVEQGTVALPPAEDTSEEDTITPPDDDEGGPDTTDSDMADPMEFLGRSDTRAMWVWSETPSARQLVENVDGAQDELIQFVNAPHGQADRSVNRLFFEARGHSNVDRFSQTRMVTYDPLLDSSKQAALRAFLKRAHSQGVDVEYLDGQAIWVANDTNAQVPKKICEDVVSFNLSTTDITERLDGVHYDIEPHTVQSGPWAGQWWQDKLPNGYNAEWTQRWKDIMNSCRATFDAYEAQTGHKLVLAGDVGADYAYYNKPILEFFNGPNSPIDYIGIMNYYDNRPNEDGQPSFFWGDHDGASMTGGVEQNLSMWTNVPVLFGVETGPTSIAPDHMSFYQEGYTSLYSVVDDLEASYATTNSMGIAIHHYSPGSYKDLQP
jgi:hypothetical protein